LEKFVIQGGTRLEGTVRNSGAKNCVLLLMAATLLTEEDCVIHNVPDLRDVHTLTSILEELGVEVTFDDHTLSTSVVDSSKCKAPYELVRKMRASICVLGPLLARREKAEVSMPGGCVIGVRPIDLHIKGLRALNADLTVEEGYVQGTAENLRGEQIFLGGPFGSTVTGTANVPMASVLADGRTVIDEAACEPEVQALAHFLNEMGANISGIGSPRLEIEGVDELHGAEFDAIPDRIEAGTYLIGAAMTGGQVTVTDTNPTYLSALIDLLEDLEMELEVEDRSISLKAPRQYPSTRISTQPYPGFPTDLQAQMMAMLSMGDGMSVITEKIYPDRFMHVPELNRMGARIQKEGETAVIQGVDFLSGAPVMASDLRASAALVLAGLVARGETEVKRIYHIDRGYEQIEEKIRQLGGRIERTPDEDEP